ncbi:MAG: hypothetical protein H7333_07410 [Bdellovibrionales bacterium]|nr:hypothetical protein [Oligoflexia bacterium]
MSKPNRYYLFKAGRLVGPVTGTKIEELRVSKEILRYSWIMDETSQSWSPIDTMPTENPFEATLATLKERTLSGAFVYRDLPFTGEVKGIHSFGLELMLPKDNRSVNHIQNNSVHLLNLIDETNLKSSNAEVIFQGIEKLTEGSLLRFIWRDAPTPL